MFGLAKHEIYKLKLISSTATVDSTMMEQKVINAIATKTVTN